MLLVKMGGSVVEEKLSFSMLGCLSLLLLGWGSNIISFAKTAFKKFGALIRSMKCLSAEVVSVNPS